MSDSIPALVLPSGGMAARHRKGVKAEQFFVLHRHMVARETLMREQRVEFRSASDITLISHHNGNAIGEPLFHATNHCAESASGNNLVGTDELDCDVRLSTVRFNDVRYLTDCSDLNFLGVDWINKLSFPFLYSILEFVEQRYVLTSIKRFRSNNIAPVMRYSSLALVKLSIDTGTFVKQESTHIIERKARFNLHRYTEPLIVPFNELEYGELGASHRTGYGSRDTVIEMPYLDSWTTPYVNTLGGSPIESPVGRVRLSLRDGVFYSRSKISMEPDCDIFSAIFRTLKFLVAEGFGTNMRLFVFCPFCLRLPASTETVNFVEPLVPEVLILDVDSLRTLPKGHSHFLKNALRCQRTRCSILVIHFYGSLTNQIDYPGNTAFHSISDKMQEAYGILDINNSRVLVPRI
ncbi:hypothetical protein CLF_102023 [Clonorchis sinensis]|uniref:Uncharacterized protein n=1 Tax=Clonorchis sinensis TaxID=79923 RepID=G7Y745_CLOSI|nr:hypothetical protein CLF_102023 [Clonorchis sinensis]